MVRKIDRTGEERLNNFGSKMVITGYRSVRDIDVYFSLNIIGNLNMYNMGRLKREM